MAGRGPSPKDPSTRARRNRPQGGDFRVIEVTPDAQPTLVDLFGDNNPVTQLPWSQWVADAWVELADFPSTQNHLRAQWRRLALGLAYEEAATLGRVAAGEGRLRIMKHFIDPDDLMRGRILTVEAEKAEKSVKKPPAPKKKPAKRPDPRAHLSSVS